jgi:general secretion pathway protein K
VKRTRDAGVALVLSLLMLVILVVLIGQMTLSGLHHRSAAENHVADLQNVYGTRTGYHRALLLLRQDAEDAPEVDGLHERWSQPLEFELGRATVRVQVVDTARLINLSRLVNAKGEPDEVVVAQLRRLVRALRHPPETADRIIDYVDADNRGEFEFRARNERLHSLDELLRIEGLEPVLVYGGEHLGQTVKGLRDFLTLWPREAKEGDEPAGINLNTASAEVLQSLSDGFDPALAEAVVTYRSRPGPDGLPQAFQKPEDLKRVPGISDTLFQELQGRVGVSATTFEIRARSSVGNIEKSWLFVVERPAAAKPGDAAETPASPAAAPRLLASQVLHDYLSTAPPPEAER